MKSNRGKYVSRSIYQKAIERNKKLLADIYVLVDQDANFTDKLEIMQKWRKKISEDRDLTNLICEVLGRSLGHNCPNMHCEICNPTNRN